MSEPQSPWQLPSPVPTTTCWFWPGDAPPTPTEVRAGLESASREPLTFDGDLKHKPAHAVWALGCFRAEPVPSIFIWAEPARSVEAGSPHAEIINRSRWIINAQTLLNDESPFESHSEMMRLLAAGMADVPLALDVECMRWWRRTELAEAYQGDHVTASPHELWVIHGVRDDKNPNAPVWIHTHGLNRCGRPELEILELPHELGRHGMHLVNEFALRLIDEPLPPPPPGEVIEVGSNMSIVLQPWQEVAKYLSSSTPGSMSDRTDAESESHAGVRAALCDPVPKGMFRRTWQHPASTLAALASDANVIYRTSRATERDAQLAHTVWPELAMAYATVRDRVGATDVGKHMLVLVKAALEADTEASDQGRQREHLWFNIEDIQGDKALGVLLNTPLRLPGVREGDRRWLDRNQISDWQAALKGGMIKPAQVRQLWRVVDAAMSAHASSSDQPRKASSHG